MGNRRRPICRYNDTIIYYQQMQKAGLKGDAYTLTALLTACERVGKWQEAVQFDADFRAAGVATNLRHHNCLISAFSTAEQWQLVSYSHHWISHLCCQIDTLATHPAGLGYKTSAGLQTILYATTLCRPWKSSAFCRSRVCDLTQSAILAQS